MTGRVVWVTPSPPDHEGGGDQQRQAFLLDTVAARLETHLVVAGAVTDGKVRRVAASVSEVEERPPQLLDDAWRRRVRMLRQLVAGRLPWHVSLAQAQVELLRPAVAERLRSGDMLVVEHLELAPLLQHLAGPDGVRRVLTLHLSHARQAAHRAEVAERWRNRLFWRREVGRSRTFERWCIAAYDAVVAVSDLDAPVADGRCSVVPNGVDLRAFRPSALPAEPDVVMTGSLDYGPNIDGLAWFCGRVWPRVREHLPDARFAVVGRRPGPSVRQLGEQPGVTVHADVPAVQPHLERARVAVVPVRLGGGTRLKALQAMAAGRPVVGTTIGLEGLGLEHDGQALIADRPTPFAEGIVRLLTDDARAARLAAAGRELVEERYGWESLGRRMVEEVLLA